ncbi:hypothetical protein F5883DRAFT_661021 [Diaporthe sp. PMI_573]|nr:hypothetical protein F5883DRAFT_661021 [Diaporthaceae sp. PMI_573]
MTTSFHVAHHLHNSLNEDLSVIVGKDGQEIEDGCGHDLIKVMEDYAEYQVNKPRGPGPVPRPGDDRGYFHQDNPLSHPHRGRRGGHRGGGHMWIKNEHMRD